MNAAMFSLAAPTLLARAALVVASAGATLWAVAAQYSVGLDFHGGAMVELAISEGVGPDKGLSAADELLAHLDLDGSARLMFESVVLELDGANDSDVERNERALSATDFRLLAPCAEPWPSATAALPALVERRSVGKAAALEAPTKDALEGALA